MSIISILDSHSKTRLDVSQLGLAVLFIMPLISSLAASQIYILDKHLTLNRKRVVLHYSEMKLT